MTTVGASAARRNLDSEFLKSAQRSGASKSAPLKRAGSRGSLDNSYNAMVSNVIRTPDQYIYSGLSVGKLTNKRAPVSPCLGLLFCRFPNCIMRVKTAVNVHFIY